jgi:hypothetical protein
MSKCDKCSKEVDIRRTRDGSVVVLDKNEVAFRLSPYGDESGYHEGVQVSGYAVSENDEQGYDYVRRLHRYSCKGEQGNG